MSSDPPLDLATAYLRLNGYFLITEQDLHVREHDGYRSHLHRHHDLYRFTPFSDPVVAMLALIEKLG